MLTIQKEKDMDWNTLWNNIVDFFTGNVWKIIGFFTVLVIGIIVIKLILNIVTRMLNKTKMEKIAEQFIRGILKFVLYLILVLMLLSIIGIQISGIVTAFSAVLLAVGMALQDNISNFANGIVIVSTKMFKKGDYITVGDVSGSITDINFLFTTLTTPDNRKITLPNNTIVNSEVTNAGANKTRRVDFTFSVAYESDVEAVKKIVIDVMNSNGKIYNSDKKPFCRLKTIGSSSLDFFANCWCDSEDYWDVYYYVVETVYNEFKKNKIRVPYTQYEVRNRTDNVEMPFDEAKLPERVEKVRNTRKNFDLETASFSDMISEAKRKTHLKKHNKKVLKNKNTEEKTSTKTQETKEEKNIQENKTDSAENK